MSAPENPLVSIITPCLNMARFVGETVRSVLAQDYANIEHIVMDGGSTDGSLQVLRSFGDRVTLYTEPDRGAADAINKGFRRARGELVTFLNADDYYLGPGAVSTAVRRLAEHPEAAGIYGGGVWVDEDGRVIGHYPVADFEPARFAEECYICQPATLLRRRVIEEAGFLDDTLLYTFDYDLWIRLSRKYFLARIEETLAASRMHTASISIGSRRAVFEETVALLKRHYAYVPFRWILSYCAHRLDRRDQFFEPLAPGFGKYLLSLPVGLFHNARHPLRYCNEWRKVMTLAALGRRLRREQ